MHAWTHSSCLESRGRHSKSHLLSLSSACDGLATVSFLICYPLHGVLGINGSWTPKKVTSQMPQEGRSDAFVCTWLSVSYITFPKSFSFQNIHICLWPAVQFIDRSRFCMSLLNLGDSGCGESCLFHQCCVMGLGDSIEVQKKNLLSKQ